MRYDVIVVGAGPGGLTAARTASENGLNVALIERKEHPAHIRRACTMMLLVIHDYIYGERIGFNQRDNRIVFPVNGFSIPYTGPHKNLYSWHFYAPDGDSFIAFGDYDEAMSKGDDGRVSIVFDKSSLLNTLLEEAEKNHTDFFPSTNVIDVRKTRDGVEVVGANGKVFEGSFVIAADGCNSNIAKRLGFNDDRFFYCTLIGYGFEVEGAEPEYPLTLKTMMDPDDPDIFHFVTPRAASDNFIVFAGGFDPRKNYDAIVNKLLTTGRYGRWFGKARKVETVAFAENVYTPIAEPFKDNCLLVGDSAWCQEIEITGAILSGFRAASAVTVALSDGKLNRDGVKSYLDWWKNSVCGLYDHRDYLRPFTMPLVMTKDEISYLFSLFPVLPSTLHAYKAVGLMGAGIQSIVPRIAQERPELLGKIQKFATMPLEDAFMNFSKNCFPNR